MRARHKTTGKKRSRRQAGGRAIKTAALASGAVVISAILIASVLFASGPLWKQSRAVELANKTASNTVTGMRPDGTDGYEETSEALTCEEDSTAPRETEEAGADTGTRSIESALTGKPAPAATVNVRTQAEREAERTPLAQYFRDKAIINKETAGEYLEIYTVPEKGDESTLADVATADTILQLLGEKDGWSNVGMGEIAGWVPTGCLLTGVQAAEYIEQTADPYAQIAVDSMNIRMGKSTGSDILDVGYKGEAYPLVSIEDGWACVKLGDVLRGYLAGNCVTINYDWNGLVIATEIAGAAEDEVKNLTAVRPTEPADPSESAPVSQPGESESASTEGLADSSAKPTDPVAQATESAAEPMNPAVQPTEPAAQPTEPQPTEPQATEPQATEPESTPQASEPQPTAPQPTEPEPTAPITVTGIEAFYIGSQQKTEGEVMSRAEICVYVYYSDGSIQVLDGNGDWYSEDIGMMLHAPEDVIKVEYAGCVSNIVLEIAAAPTEPQPTEPEPTEPQPTEPQPTEPQPTEPQPTEPEPTEPEATEPQPTEPEPTEPQPDEAYVNNVALSGELTAYALRLCSQYGVDSSVIFSVMYQESKFNPGATSPSGAIGLMQIIPGYSQARMQRLGVTDLYDARSNMLVGIDMLAEYYYQYGGWVPALTRYRYGSPSASGDYAALILSRTGMFQ